jgi:hypothetical protein
MRTYPTIDAAKAAEPRWAIIRPLSAGYLPLRADEAVGHPTAVKVVKGSVAA